MKNVKPFYTTSEKIRSLQKLILSEWEEVVRESLDEHKKESGLILRDHMPKILDNLCATMKGRHTDDSHEAKAHGYQRAILTQFTIEDLLNEYALLRETLINYIYPIGDLDCVKFVHHYIDNLTKHSVIEFIQHLQISSRVILEDSPRDSDFHSPMS